jgi:TM2 domain-containing membrane protein YozV
MDRLCHIRAAFPGILLLAGGLVGALPRTAAAQQVPRTDVVYLRDGGIVHGVIVEEVPGKSILIRTSDGNQFRYQMSQIAGIQTEAPAPAARPAPALAPALAPAPQQPPFVQKSPGTALLLSFLIPGAGQLYNGQNGKALLHFGVAAVATGVAISGFSSADCQGYYYTYWDTFVEAYSQRWVGGGSCGVGYGALAVALGIHIWSMVDASASASRLNHLHGLAVRLEPWIRPRTGPRGRLGMRLCIDMALPPLAR